MPFLMQILHTRGGGEHIFVFQGGFRHETNHMIRVSFSESCYVRAFIVWGAQMNGKKHVFLVMVTKKDGRKFRKNIQKCVFRIFFLAWKIHA